MLKKLLNILLKISFLIILYKFILPKVKVYRRNKNVWVIFEKNSLYSSLKLFKFEYPITDKIKTILKIKVPKFEIFFFFFC
jgi:hypothetical protein